MQQDLLELERLIDRGESAIAVPILERAVEMEPGYAAARLLLARAYEGEGRMGDAVSEWRLVRALVPDSPTAVTGLKRALRLRMLWAADPAAWATDDGAVAAAAAPEPAEPPAAEPPEPVAVEPDEPPAAEPPEPVALEPAEPPAEEPPEPVALEPEEPPAAEPIAAEPEEPPERAEPPEPDKPMLPHAPPIAESPDAEPEVSGWDDEAPQNLDELIRELETARIVPDPTIPPAVAEDLEPDVDDVVSETLARIYENQRHYGEAARVYEKLALQQPGRAPEFQQKAADLRTRAGT
jgi:tetratricopeptide (TPR) repeat protein